MMIIIMDYRDMTVWQHHATQLIVDMPMTFSSEIVSGMIQYNDAILLV